MAPITQTRPTTLSGQWSPVVARGAWVLSSHTVDKAGHVVGADAAERAVVAACHLTRNDAATRFASCANRLGFRDVVKVQPADRFWALQAWESALFLGIAIGLAAFCFWWVRHRTA